MSYFRRFGGYFRRRRRGYYPRRNYGRRTVVVNRYRRGGGSSGAWRVARKSKQLVKYLTIALILVGAFAIFKPAWLKTAMQKIGLKTA